MILIKKPLQISFAFFDEKKQKINVINELASDKKLTELSKLGIK